MIREKGKPHASFKNTLIGGNSQAEGAVYDDWVSNNEDEDWEEEIDPICPNIKV